MSENSKSNRGRKRCLTDSARKRNRATVASKWNKSRVYIGNQFERWNELKAILNVDTHAEVANVLLNNYHANNIVDAVSDYQPNSQKSETEELERTVNVVSKDTAVTSTPGPSHIHSRFHTTCDVSDISSAGEYHRESDMSGIEEFCSSAKKAYEIEKSTSFINPFDLTIDEDEMCLLDDDSSDSDEEFQPNFNLTLRPSNADQLPIEYSDDESDTCDDDPADAAETDYKRVNSIEDVETLITDRPLLVYQQPLLDLANTQISTICKICNEAVSICVDNIGSATYLKWVCKLGHVANRWCSQSILNRRMHAGDLVFASAILLSGNNFQKISTLAKFLKLPILSSSSFHRIQKTYLVPSIDRFWIQKQESTLREFQNTDIIVLGDGRMDSPGHCAQYCSYTFMEYTSKKILCITTMDKRSTDRKSTNLEKACFLRGMQFFKDKGIKVVEVVTDAHVQIASVMRKDFPDIKHSFDVWHGTKNLGKKLTKISQEKGNKELSGWVKDVVNHYWHSAEVSTTCEEFLDVWYGMLHHIVNEHEWFVPFANSTVSTCQHGPLEDGSQTKEYLKKGSAAHNALRQIVMDKRLVKNIPYYLNCRSTSELENFQNLILVYSSKRHSYSPPVYRARNRLAALDHNSHAEREVMKNKDGSLRWQRSYNKKTSRWSVHPVKVEKNYSYVQDLIRHIITSRIEDDIGMNRPMELEADDPRRISAHLAPVPPPSTRDIVASQISRFENLNKTIEYWTAEGQ
ncbi:uncharacterized protein LOC128190849 [Crassostrea angulata]|uniref:uncharacterized protein LOC128164652 n=1 Tax=Magallana angulata TaxID=2784310 RepID=UPI0022B160F9|nr:uncharacterized protein LOC128164652 [Crassostrea angulata]XP_052718965.1 uncharacterized protein LOC128190805 [Crassostrea angulata]XP_052719022.1 uncharacterized protein LOC128190849 [Crassostrea angulata]